MFGHSYYGNEYFHGNYFGPIVRDKTPGDGGRQYTPEEIEGLEAIWGAVKGDYEFEFEPTIQEIEDISLIIAIDEATEKNTYYTV